jgi:serine kinase of HPr protein (carbohydrate metabolism regulator)
MSNINIIAVASLADVSCIILSEGVTVGDDIIATAEQKEINILSSALPSYETAVKVSEQI